MGEGLREISQCRTCRKIDFLAEQTNIVAITEQMLEQGLCFLDIAAPGKVFDCPEAAYAERALAGCPAVETSTVTREEIVAAELLPDARVSVPHARVPGIGVTDTRQQQQTCVHLL